jgi:hypothetical protein
MIIICTPTINIDDENNLIDESLTTIIEGTDADAPDDCTIISRWDTDEYNTMAAKMEGEMRAERNRLLAETDFHALSDMPTMSDEMRAYRQALRDLPANISSVANPDYPIKP